MADHVSDSELMRKYKANKRPEESEEVDAPGTKLPANVAPRICPKCKAKFTVTLLGQTPVERLQLCPDCLPKPVSDSPQENLELTPPRRTHSDDEDAVIDQVIEDARR